jgi:hypothetical protein
MVLPSACPPTFVHSSVLPIMKVFAVTNIGIKKEVIIVLVEFKF